MDRKFLISTFSILIFFIYVSLNHVAIQNLLSNIITKTYNPDEQLTQATNTSFNSSIIFSISLPNSWYILPRPPWASKGV